MVLTCQADLARQALFQLMQAVRIEIHAVCVMAQFIAGFADLDRGLFQHVQQAA
ncbi:hypothetical protein D3C75_1175120 [compost metagenome]